MVPYLFMSFEPPVIKKSAAADGFWICGVKNGISLRQTPLSPAFSLFNWSSKIDWLLVKNIYATSAIFEGHLCKELWLIGIKYFHDTPNFAEVYDCNIYPEVLHYAFWLLQKETTIGEHLALYKLRMNKRIMTSEKG